MDAEILSHPPEEPFLIKYKRMAKQRAISDEDIYTFFEPELPFERECNSNGKLPDCTPLAERRLGTKNGERITTKSICKLSAARSRNFPQPSSDLSGVHGRSSIKDVRSKEGPLDEVLRRQEGSSVLDLKGENYFSCAVGRKRSNARYSLPSSEDVISFIKVISKSHTRIVK